jgi:hypothetical protein
MNSSTPADAELELYRAFNPSTRRVFEGFFFHNAKAYHFKACFFMSGHCL